MSAGWFLLNSLRGDAVQACLPLLGLLVPPCAWLVGTPATTASTFMCLGGPRSLGRGPTLMTSL